MKSFLRCFAGLRDQPYPYVSTQDFERQLTRVKDAFGAIIMPFKKPHEIDIRRYSVKAHYYHRDSWELYRHHSVRVTQAGLRSVVVKLLARTKAYSLPNCFNLEIHAQVGTQLRVSSDVYWINCNLNDVLQRVDSAIRNTFERSILITP